MTSLYIMVAVLFVISALISLLKPTIKGKSGEAIVGVILNTLPKEEYRSIHNVLLKTDRGTSQIDYLVVSIYGIFVIEVKNYTGWITGSEYGNQWTQTIYHTKHRFLNPIHQNYGHVKAVEALLDDPSIPVYPIVTFSGDCDLKVKTEESQVGLWGDLKDMIRKDSVSQVMNIAEMERITSLFQNSNIDSRENRKEHLQEIRSQQNQIREGICPRCGGRLVVRHGRYGDFLGCSNYPRCRYTKDLKS